MTKSMDAVVLALIATLDERAKKNGDKSIVKSVVGRLADAGASKELIAEITALRRKKTVKAKPAARSEAAPKANGKSKSAASEPAASDVLTVVG